jgi:hypothetical protein
MTTTELLTILNASTDELIAILPSLTGDAHATAQRELDARRNPLDRRGHPY